MAAALGERQNNVSNHLARLREAGLVRADPSRGDARWVYYERDEAAAPRPPRRIDGLLGDDARASAGPASPFWLVVVAGRRRLARRLVRRRARSPTGWPSRLLGLERGSQLGEAVAFFLSTCPRSCCCCSGIVTVVTFMRCFFPPEKVRARWPAAASLAGTVAAAAFGIVTPFCSCSAVPLFIGFVEAGVPLGVTFAFLVSSPMVNEVALVLLWGLFGPAIALVYMVAGLVVAIVAGLVIGSLGLERYVEDYVWEAPGRGRGRDRDQADVGGPDARRLGVHQGPRPPDRCRT